MTSSAEKYIEYLQANEAAMFAARAPDPEPIPATVHAFARLRRTPGALCYSVYPILSRWKVFYWKEPLLTLIERHLTHNPERIASEGRSSVTIGYAWVPSELEQIAEQRYGPNTDLFYPLDP